MANRCGWPAIWLLLALLMRVEYACAQRTYPRPTQYQPRKASSPTRHATTNRIQPSPAYTEPWQEADYTSSESYPPRGQTTFARTSMSQVNEINQSPPVEYELSQEAMEEEVYAQEQYGAESYGPVGYPGESYGAENFDDSYFGDDAWEESHAPPKRGRMHHFLNTFKPPEGAWFRTSKNSPRSIGVGEPLRGTSWLNRPNSISFFAGILNGDQLITDRVDQGSALFGGLRMGWDFDHYWGLEVRGGWASPELEYPTPPAVEHVDGIFLADASVLYYPWGDSSWRPYGLLGMGMARFDFTDEVGVVYDEYLLGIPLGFGMKYMYHPNIVFRAEFLDNIACGSSGIRNMNNLSFTLGVELRYGGKPRSYYPWQPAKYIW